MGDTHTADIRIQGGYIDDTTCFSRDEMTSSGLGDDEEGVEVDVEYLGIQFGKPEDIA
jgi:hypothetical protein